MNTVVVAKNDCSNKILLQTFMNWLKNTLLDYSLTTVILYWNGLAVYTTTQALDTEVKQPINLYSKINFKVLMRSEIKLLNKSGIYMLQSALHSIDFITVIHSESICTVTYIMASVNMSHADDMCMWVLYYAHAHTTDIETT